MLFATLFGTAVFAMLLTWIVRANAAMWGVIAASYADSSPRPVIARRFPEQVVIAAGGLAFRSYVPLTVRIHAEGISLRLLPPFSLSCPPLFLPFPEMTCRRTDWYLNAPSFAMRLARADADIILTEELWNWIRSNTDLTLSYGSDARRHAGQAPIHPA